MWTFCLSVVVFGLASCDERQWYKKELEDDTKKKYAVQLRSGAFYRNYQGTVAEQMHHYEALRLDSTNGDLWRELGTARVKRGILDEMDFYYAEAVKRKPEKWAGFRGYLYLYFYRDFERAIADFNLNDEVMGEVSHSQGQDHDYMRGIAYYGLADYGKALDFLSRYIERVEEEEGAEWVDVYAYLYQGLTLMKLGKDDEAIAAFDDVLTHYPRLVDAYLHKAKVYQAKNELEKAQQQLLKAEEFFNMGYFHQRPYVEVLEQVYRQDIEEVKEVQKVKEANS